MIRTRFVVLFALFGLTVSIGCSDEEGTSANNDAQDVNGLDAANDAAVDPPGDTGGGSDTSGPDAHGNDEDGGSDSGDEDGGSNGNSGDAGDAGTDTSTSQYCPTDVLPQQTMLVYQGSTVGNDNLFESSRLEWDDAGDDALLYTAPEAGTYEFSLSAGLTDVQGCGVSIDNRTTNNMTFHSPATCPADGATAQLPDAYFVAGEGSSGTADLTQGQELLILVSCASWSTPVKEVDYTLTITKQ